MVDTAAVIASGRYAPVMDMNREGDEMAKRLDAALRGAKVAMPRRCCAPRS